MPFDKKKKKESYKKTYLEGTGMKITKKGGEGGAVPPRHLANFIRRAENAIRKKKKCSFLLLAASVWICQYKTRKKQKHKFTKT